tara:strand:+ start:3442 stop:4437 length:996 start_codon:yes stop_codon:yes gene_type:complete
MKATTLKKAALVAGSLSFLAGSAFSQSAVSGAGGYETLTINAGKFNVLGLRLHEPQVVSGTFDANTVDSLTDNDVNFTDVLTAGKRYLVEIADSGCVIEVDAWSGSDLTGLAGVEAADASDYTIRAAKTIGDVFGAENSAGLTASANADPSEASVIYVPSGSGFTQVFYSTLAGFSGWLDAGTFADASDLPLNYVDGLIVNEKGAANISLVVTGMVKTTSTLLPVSDAFTYLGTAYPVGSTLGNSGLADSVSGSENADPSEADTVYLPKPDASGYDQYFFSTLAGFDGWLNSATFAAAGDIELTSGIIISQNGTGAAFNATVTPPAFYADL